MCIRDRIVSVSSRLIVNQAAYKTSRARLAALVGAIAAAVPA